MGYGGTILIPRSPHGEYIPITDMNFPKVKYPESYAGGSVATGRASHAGQVKGDDPDEKRYPGPPGWGLGHGADNPISIK
jgi:hypothetical protein